MRFKTVGLGEVLWDLLPEGRQLGGAPANFAYHAHALGAESRVITRVGNDEAGREVLARFRALGLPTDTVAVDATAPTGTVTVEIAADGQAHYTIHEHVAWDRIEAGPTELEVMALADAVCFGSLAQRTPPASRAILELVAASPSQALRVFDINLRRNFFTPTVIRQSLELANVLKLNDAELPVVANLLNLTGTAEEQLSRLAEQFDLQCVALTRGANGAVLYSRGKFSEQAGQPVKLQDTIGAGDSFGAALTLGLLAGWPLDQINSFANEVARHVCSSAGATPPLPDHLRDRFARGNRRH